MFEPSTYTGFVCCGLSSQLYIFSVAGIWTRNARFFVSIHIHFNLSTINHVFYFSSQTMGANQESSSEKKNDLPKQLLSLDGGGVKGISSLLILDAIMKEVRARENESGSDPSTDDRKPVHYFHLAAGTSTGGLIALMLFRLHMSVPEVIAQYKSLAAEVFAPRFFGFPLHEWGTAGYWLGNGYLKAKAVVSQAQFSDEPLKEAINKVVKNHGLDEDDRNGEGDAPLRHKDAGHM
jgi:hypothetical protein